MKSIVMIDPNDTEEYIYGLLKALKEHARIILVTKKSSRIAIDGIEVKKWFYKDTTRTKLYAGLNYLWTYLKIILMVYFRNLEIVHIQWFKMEKIDLHLVRILKKKCYVVHTAHNILPHVNGESKREQYKKLYDEVDKIIVHGKAIQDELSETMDIALQKIDIQPYGFSDLKEFPVDTNSELLAKVKTEKVKYQRMYLAIGLINSYKGTDRLLRIWNSEFIGANALLVVAGKVDEKTHELEEELSHLASNVLFFDQKLSGFEFEKLCEMAEMIILPYRNASMSGVVYSAARASTTVLTTDVGTIPDYLVHGEDAFVVENTENAIRIGIEIANAMDISQLHKMGSILRSNFENKYKWNAIASNLMKYTYGCEEKK